jgi:Ankyrin repeats (3 copies)/Ankyrin repeats (many copies)
VRSSFGRFFRLLFYGIGIAACAFGWFLCIAAIFTFAGDRWAFLIFGASLLLFLIPRLKSTTHNRYTRSVVKDRAYEVLAFLGILLLSFSVWRFVAGRAFDNRVSADLSAGDPASLVREASNTLWPDDRRHAEEALHHIIARKAENLSANCMAAGDQAVRRPTHLLVWDVDRDSPHGAMASLDKSNIYQHGDGPLTVFLVSGKQSAQVGTYSISRQPAFREWVNVCVIQFDAVSEPGKPVAFHAVVSLDPAQSRVVSNRPEYGNPVPAVVEWICCGGIHYAARDGDFAKVKALVQDYPDLVFTKSENGQTPLHFAAENGHRDVAELLLANKAEVNARDTFRKTPLHYAAENGHKDVAELLLANKADVNAKESLGETPLNEAVLWHHADVAELLRQRGGRE